jgi:RNA recognition motif-containing protein
MDLLCTNFPPGVSEERLREVFSDFGQITDMEMHAGFTIEGTWRGHCYVTMPDAAAIAALSALSGAPWCGRRLSLAVTYLRPRAVAPAEPIGS